MYDRAFKTLKYILTNALFLSLPNFDKSFEIECDAYGTEIGAVLMLDSKPNTYFSEKLSGVLTNFCILIKFLPLLPKEYYLSPSKGIKNLLTKNKACMLIIKMALIMILLKF